MKLRLQDVLDSINGCGLIGNVDPVREKFYGVSIDSRTVHKNQLFFAIKGENFDGHDFVRPAIEGGAKAVVVEREWIARLRESWPSIPCVVVDDTLIALQELSRYYRSTFQLPLVAVTGSVGKTTAKEAISAVLSKKYNVLKSPKSFNNHVGVPLTLLNITKAHDVVLTEIGTNHFGEIDRLSFLAQPTHALVLNISFAHLEFLGSLEGVAKEKFEIFNHVAKDGTAFLNGDDTILRSRKVPIHRVVTYGVENPNDIQATIIGCDSNACYRFKVLGKEIQLQVPGKHNVHNALAAVAVGNEFGISPAEIKEALEEFISVEKRMQVVNLANGIVILDDTYNANPASVKAALATLKDLKSDSTGRQVVVLGDMLELGMFSESKHRELGKHVADYGIAGLFGYGENMAFAVTEAKKAGLSFSQHFSEKNLLIESLIKTCEPDDQILVKGSRAMRMEDVVTALIDKYHQNTKN